MIFPKNGKKKIKNRSVFTYFFCHFENVNCYRVQLENDELGKKSHRRLPRHEHRADGKQNCHNIRIIWLCNSHFPNFAEVPHSAALDPVRLRTLLGARSHVVEDVSTVLTLIGSVLLRSHHISQIRPPGMARPSHRSRAALAKKSQIKSWLHKKKNAFSKQPTLHDWKFIRWHYYCVECVCVCVCVCGLTKL